MLRTTEGLIAVLSCYMMTLLSRYEVRNVLNCTWPQFPCYIKYIHHGLFLFIRLCFSMFYYYNQMYVYEWTYIT